jgi:hypothetical protein
MGEAWFMGEERQFFTELMDCEPTELSRLDLEEYIIYDIACGTRNFGHRDEWTHWFNYFLAHLTTAQTIKVCDLTLVEMLTTALVTQYSHPDLLQKAGLRQDVLRTLGQSLMSPECWNMKTGELRIEALGLGSWQKHEVGGAFSATLFCCWKYLQPDELESWLECLFGFTSAHWRAQFLLWLLSARHAMDGKVKQPAEFNKLKPSLAWKHSDFLDGHYEGFPSKSVVAPFISGENINAFQTALGKFLTQALLLEWLDSCLGLGYFELEFPEFAEAFADHLR